MTAQSTTEPVSTRPWGGALAIVLLSFAVGASLRFLRLDRHDAWWDEGISWAIAQSPSPVETIREHAEGESPLFHVLLHQVTGRDAPLGTLRRFPATCSTLALLFWAFLLWRIVGPRGAAIGAPLLALSSFQVFHSQELRTYPLTTLIAMVVLLLHLELAKSDRVRPWTWFGLAISEALLIYSHYLAAAYMLGLAVAVAALPSLRRHWKGWLAAQVAGALLVVPWLGVIASCFHHVQGEQPISDFRWLRDLCVPSGILFLGRSLITSPSSALYRLQQLAEGLAATLALSSLLGGAWVLWRRGRMQTLGILVAASHVPIGILVLFSLLVFPEFNYGHTKYAIWAQAPLYLCGVIWLDAVWERGRREIVLLFLTIFIAINGWSHWNYFFEVEYLRAPAYREMAERLEQESLPGDEVLYDWLGTLQGMDPAMCARPRLRALRRGLLVELVPDGPSGRFGPTGLEARWNDPLPCAGKRVWVLLYHDWRARREEGFEKARLRLLRNLETLEIEGRWVQRTRIEVRGIDAVCMERR